MSKTTKETKKFRLIRRTTNSERWKCKIKYDWENKLAHTIGWFKSHTYVCFSSSDEQFYPNLKNKKYCTNYYIYSVKMIKKTQLFFWVKIFLLLGLVFAHELLKFFKVVKWHFQKRALKIQIWNYVLRCQ